MLKAILTLFSAFVLFGTAFAQKTFDLTLKFDESINPKKAFFSYFDGKRDIMLSDTPGMDRISHIRKKYYSRWVSFTVSYIDSAKIIHSNDFFISDKPATITIHFSPGMDELGYTSIHNASLIFDTVANKGWARIMNMRKMHHSDEDQRAQDFVAKNPGFAGNDSLMAIFKKFSKEYLIKDMSYLKKYPNNYFSFWFFIHQTSQVNGLLKDDKVFLQQQLRFFKTTFPTKYVSSIEGRQVIKTFEDKINKTPLKLNQPAPLFAVIDDHGKKISLDQLKGRYVLLDFWATWCGPCMAEMPFVKQIRQQYPADKLTIIGINWDTNSARLNAAVKQYNLIWPQYLDIDKNLGARYSVSAIPVLILIDKRGKIIYQSDAKYHDQERLPAILNSLN